MKEDSVKLADKGFNPGRREFGKLALAGVLGGGSLLSNATCSATKKKSESKKDASDIFVSKIVNSDASDKELFFFKQLGLDHVMLYIGGEDEKYDNLLGLNKKYQAAGLTIDAICNRKYWAPPDEDVIRMGFPGRDKKIEDFKMMLRNMARVGIPICRMGAWTSRKAYGYGSGREGLTRGCRTKESYYEEVISYPNVYDRVYSLEYIWDTFDYFMKRVIPVAEENGIKLAIHPWIPVPILHGVGNIIHSHESMKRAVEVAGSKNFGFNFCTGEMGTGGGENGLYGDIVELARYWCKRDRVFSVHFRNISDHFPNKVVEVFPDNGYHDMYKILKTFKEVGYKGPIIPDHIPNCATEKSSAGHGVGAAYCVAYIKGLLDAVNKEAVSG